MGGRKNHFFVSTGRWWNNHLHIIYFVVFLRLLCKFWDRNLAHMITIQYQDPLVSTSSYHFEPTHFLCWVFLFLFDDYRAIEFLFFRTLGSFGPFFSGCHYLATSPLLSCAVQSPYFFFTRFGLLSCFSSSSRLCTHFHLLGKVFNYFGQTIYESWPRSWGWYFPNNKISDERTSFCQ